PLAGRRGARRVRDRRDLRSLLRHRQHRPDQGEAEGARGRRRRPVQHLLDDARAGGDAEGVRRRRHTVVRVGRGVDLRALLEVPLARPLSFSRDGTQLLIACNAPGSDQLFVWPGMKQVTFDEEPVAGQFLPDDRILVERDSGGNERTQLYVGDEPLVVDERYKHDTPHSAGRTLAYATNRRNGVDFDVVARDLETGEERVFEIGGYTQVAAISPDGRKIVADRGGLRSGDNDLFLCDLDTGEVTHLTPHDEPAEYVTPVFRGDELVWATNEGRDTFAAGGYESEWDVLCYGDPAGCSLLLVEN